MINYDPAGKPVSSTAMIEEAHSRNMHVCCVLCDDPSAGSDSVGVSAATLERSE